MNLTEKMEQQKINKAFNFTPRGIYVIAIGVDEDKSEGGVILPKNNEENYRPVQILGMGAKAKKELQQDDIVISKGDQVYVHVGYLELVIKRNNVNLLVFRPDAIIGKIDSKLETA